MSNCWRWTLFFTWHIFLQVDKTQDLSSTLDKLLELLYPLPYLDLPHFPSATRLSCTRVWVFQVMHSLLVHERIAWPEALGTSIHVPRWNEPRTIGLWNVHRITEAPVGISMRLLVRIPGLNWTELLYKGRYTAQAYAHVQRRLTEVIEHEAGNTMSSSSSSSSPIKFLTYNVWSCEHVTVYRRIRAIYLRDHRAPWPRRRLLAGERWLTLLAPFLRFLSRSRIPKTHNFRYILIT
jgi:hypothetical protein